MSEYEIEDVIAKVEVAMDDMNILYHQKTPVLRTLREILLTESD
jgi:hypothetical protein